MPRDALYLLEIVVFVLIIVVAAHVARVQRRKTQVQDLFAQINDNILNLQEKTKFLRTRYDEFHNHMAAVVNQHNAKLKLLEADYSKRIKIDKSMDRNIKKCEKCIQVNPKPVSKSKKRKKRTPNPIEIIKFPIDKDTKNKDV